LQANLETTMPETTMPEPATVTVVEHQSLIPSGLPPERALILSKALVDLGLREQRTNRGPIVEGRGIDRFLPAHIRNDPNAEGIPYCASAVCTWWFDALVRHPLGSLVRGADTLKDTAKAHQLWRDMPCVPTPGDAFVFLHSVDRPGFDKGHTGLVLRVSADGREIETIEGNCRNAVRIIKRPLVLDRALGKEDILGFATPFAGAPPTGWARGLSGRGESPGGSTV
jgi:hypothetical protein